MTTTIRIKTKDKARARAFLRQLPQVLSGRKVHANARLYEHFWGVFTKEMFKKLSEAYKVKSEGGTDELGNKWKPLSRSTIAQRPLGRGESRKFGVRKQRDALGILTRSQTTLWKGIFASTMKRLAPLIGLEAAKKQAGKLAWGIVKARGGRTKLDVLGSRDVLIMRDTERLYDSFLPGKLSGGVYTPRSDQVFRLTTRTLTIGSDVPYADDASKDRPVIPSRIDKWVSEAIDVAINETMKNFKTGL